MPSREPLLVALEASGDARLFWRETRRVWDRGDAVLPLPPLPPPGRTRIIEALRPAATGAPTGRRTRPEPVPVPPGTAVVMLTSGSSGDTPKAALLSHDALAAAAAATITALGLETGDTWLCALPVHHIAGFMTLVRSMHAGSEPVFAAPGTDRLEPAGAAAVSLVPTMLARLVASRTDLTPFRVVLVGGGPAPPGPIRAARAAGVKVVTSYGMTETCGGFVLDGIPVPGARVKVAADGEILVQGPMLTSGYRLDPVGTRAALRDGWFHTGDVGAIDEAATLHVVGRRDDVIVTGGEKVVPSDVERALGSHPALREAVVVGVPDDEWGEAVVAFVVADGPSPSTAELQALVARHGPRHWVPKEIRVTDDLPRLASGKPDRAALRTSAAPLGT